MPWRRKVGSVQNNIVYINLGNYGSTGKIVDGLTEIAENNGCKVMRCYPGNALNPEKRENDYVISSYNNRRVNHRLSIHTGLLGCFAFFSTFRVIRSIKKFRPDTIHLHNLHGDYINLAMLFHYLKNSGIKVVWTLHDCWAFTGRCPHFQIAGCEKWLSGCGDCPYPRDSYPESFVDLSGFMWKMKKKLFTGIPNMILVTPSKWLTGLTKQSFLKDYEVRTIYNGIDLQVFKPTESKFREIHGIPEDGYLVLGIAFNWNERKGLDIFLSLRELLDDKYYIVLVGTDCEVDKLLSPKIISIHRTMNQSELAEIYTAADVFVNPTREEALGLTNIESLACGTSVITFDTGGSPECIDAETGIVIDKNDSNVMKNLVNSIEKMCTGDRKRNQCLKRAKLFNEKDTYLKYLNLY